MDPAFAVGRGCRWIEGEHKVMREFVRKRHECCRTPQTNRSVGSERCTHATLHLIYLLLSMKLDEQPSRLLGRPRVRRPASIEFQLRRLDPERGAHRQYKIGNVCICHRKFVKLLNQKGII